MKYAYRIAVGITFGFLFVTAFVLYQRLGVFGCFDECPNYAVGYFLSQGRQLYSQIFFNHQPLLPIISYLLQHVGNPHTLYELVRLHRLFVIIFSLVLDGLLIWRFGWLGIGFSLLYESTKYYWMGSLFLGESLSAYLYVYVFFVVCDQWVARSYKKIDSALVPCMIWAGIFLREPYIPLAIFLFLSYLINSKKMRSVAIMIFICLSALTLWQLPVREYWFDVVSVNAQALISPEMQKMGTGGLGIVKSFLYPLLVWFGDKWNILRAIECGISFGVLVFGYFYCRKASIQKFFCVWVATSLGLSALRYVPVGTLYYEAFHLLPWWGLMVAFLTLSVRDYWITGTARWRKYILIWYFIFLGVLIFSSNSFYWERFDIASEFATGYARYSLNTEAINAISTPSNTLFLDMWDDILYVTTKLQSAYTYSWYIPVMNSFEKYRQARLSMFVSNPPDFYYYSCEKQEATVPISSDILRLYVRLEKDGLPSCIFVRTSIVAHIVKEKREALRRVGFTIPE